MEKYKEILKQIICDNECSKNDFIGIYHINFKEYGIECTFHYYGNNDKKQKSVINIFNSQLNAYMFDHDEK